MNHKTVISWTAANVAVARAIHLDEIGAEEYT